MYNIYMFADINVSGFNGKDARSFSYKYEGFDLSVGDLVKLKFAGRNSIGIVVNPNAKRPSKDIKLQTIQEKLPIDPVPQHLLFLGGWMVDYYSASAASVWQLFLPKNLTTKKPRNNFRKIESKTLPLAKLTSAQVKALKSVTSSTKPVLLEGAMGSGKTEIYFHLISEAIKKNKSSILMMPEIFLTKQMILRAQKHFGNKLIITHSSMTPAERRSVWEQCNSRSKSEGLIVLGPRSSMFSPLHNLGLILIDEFHEQSYKQDSSPRYQTEIVAAKLASLTNSKLVIGSATPSITARFLADNKKLEHVVLKERALNSVHPKIQLVKISSGEIISKELKDKIDAALNNKKMSLIYINRRGTAPVYKCNDCGHGFECPNCGINLHFHADSMKLVCHVCDYKIQPPAKCPTCKGSNLRGVGVGTKAVLNELQDMFADAKIARIDTDSSKQKEFAETLDKINDGKVDIIVGTQMIGRGMDIANLELVGMINADYDLMSVDYNSLERAFQLLTQTAGRAGRRETQGEVIIQTSQPDNPMLELIIKNDFDSLYMQELKQRKKYSYPPYVYLLKLECGFVSPNLGKQKANDLIKSLKGKPIAVLGPVKSHPAIKGKKHMWSLVIKSKNRNALQEIAKDLDQFWTINLDPFGIS